jgi:hypothetical protein
MRQGRFITTALAAAAVLAIGPASAMATAGSFTDDTAADFAAGTIPGTAWIVEPGTVALKHTSVADNFDGTTLGPAVGLPWTQTSWDTPTPGGGTATVSGGSLSVDGKHINDAQPHGDYTPGKVMDFRATFGAKPFQNVGLGDTFNDVPWAMFGTGSDPNDVALFAWVRSATSAPDPVRLNASPTVPHRYRIVWSASDVKFYVDGALVSTQTITIDAMRPVISDLTADGTPVRVDSLGMSVLPFSNSGDFVSQVFDTHTASNITWGSVDVGALDALPIIKTRTGNTPFPDASWSGFQPLVNGAIQSPSGRRYIQYMASLTGSEPSLDSVVIHYDIASASQPNGGSAGASGGGQTGGGQTGVGQTGGGNSSADKTAPKATLVAKSLRVKKGSVSFTVGCPATEKSCTIKLSLRNGTKTVASKTVTVKGGKTKTVSLTLNSAAKKLLKKRSSLTLSAVLKATDAAGNHRTTTKKVTLRR